jgi:hypothetical protein
MTVAGGSGPALGTVARDLRAPRAAGVAGLAFSVLFVASILLLRNHPGSGTSAEEMTRWYLEDRARHLALVGLYLVPFAGITFLWFVAVARHRVGHREDRFFDTVFLGSSLLFVAMMFGAAAAAGAPLAAVKFLHASVPSPGAIELARGLGYTLLFVYAVRMAAVFMVVVSTMGLRTGGLPRWLAWSGYAIALVLLFSVSFVTLVVLLFPLWVAAVSIAVLVTDRVGGDAGQRVGTG